MLLLFIRLFPKFTSNVFSSGLTAVLHFKSFETPNFHAKSTSDLEKLVELSLLEISF